MKELITKIQDYIDTCAESKSHVKTAALLAQAFMGLKSQHDAILYNDQRMNEMADAANSAKLHVSKVLDEAEAIKEWMKKVGNGHWDYTPMDGRDVSPREVLNSNIVELRDIHNRL